MNLDIFKGGIYHVGFQVVLVVKNPPANAGDIRDAGLIPRLDPLEVGLVFIWGLFWWLSW